MSDAKDCIYKRSQFIGSVNKLLGNYEHIPNDVLCRLFSIYCSFYGSQLWGCASEGFSRYVTEWNKAVRRVLHVSNCTHRWMLGPLSGQVNITEQLHVMTTKQIHNSIVHCNSIVRLVANRALHCARSPMGANVAYLRCKYGVDFTNALNANINSINVFHQLDEHCHRVMSMLLDLRNCLRGTVEIDGFSLNDIGQIMDCIYVKRTLSPYFRNLPLLHITIRLHLIWRLL